MLRKRNFEIKKASIDALGNCNVEFRSAYWLGISTLYSGWRS